MPSDLVPPMHGAGKRGRVVQPEAAVEAANQPDADVEEEDVAKKGPGRPSQKDVDAQFSVQSTVSAEQDFSKAQFAEHEKK